MKYSLVNNEFYATRLEEINALPNSVGNFSPSIIGRLTGLRSVDIREMPQVTIYTAPERIEVPDGEGVRLEADDEYGARVMEEVVAGVEQVIAGTLDGIYLDSESQLKLYRYLVGWSS